MKKDIHPKWYKQAKVVCNCGNTFTTGSTLPEIKVEICSSCHPFFTGELKYVDTQGRVEKFQKKQEVAEKTKLKKKKKLMRKRPVRPQTLREMLINEKK
ncbi:MAG: 50S ribosomal protein L31 [Patescibacteria group bacterium]|nr:50S ribosomal protein L31 [Patescibacteria group bacterium]